ncbi:hypothetical protein BpHYR1_041748 [Brachionus plicatilis]|uniref:Uncharacterized protein n=1 Tax=Brachionus plicatilis TaxID=10195 RepID=A0A3M7RVG9_BRAPC|nr:hypothetical protein BpHYR1_041748 [Brachionus plicatilis]
MGSETGVRRSLPFVVHFGVSGLALLGHTGLIARRPVQRFFLVFDTFCVRIVEDFAVGGRKVRISGIGAVIVSGIGLWIGVVIVVVAIGLRGRARSSRLSVCWRRVCKRLDSGPWKRACVNTPNWRQAGLGCFERTARPLLRCIRRSLRRSRLRICVVRSGNLDWISVGAWPWALVCFAQAWIASLDWTRSGFGSKRCEAAALGPRCSWAQGRFFFPLGPDCHLDLFVLEVVFWSRAAEVWTRFRAHCGSIV